MSGIYKDTQIHPYIPRAIMEAMFEEMETKDITSVSFFIQEILKNRYGITDVSSQYKKIGRPKGSKDVTKRKNKQVINKRKKKTSHVLWRGYI